MFTDLEFITRYSTELSYQSKYPGWQSRALPHQETSCRGGHWPRPAPGLLLRRRTRSPIPQLTLNIITLTCRCL